MKQAIEGAAILLGAERMIADYQPKLEKKPYYMASQILPYLKEIQQREFFEAGCKVVVLFSGDTDSIVAVPLSTRRYKRK